MRERIEQFDWASTPLGPMSAWPQSLRTSLSICLASRFPILIWWGPDLLKLYNDAYAPFLGSKHPAALGAPGRTVWPEIWDVIGPMLDQVLLRGEATWSDDQLLMLHRHGYSEECYFTFSYSPIVDESGGVGGIFTAVTETTKRVLSERRLDTLRQLAAKSNDARTAEEACRNAVDILRLNAKDVPFAAVYLRRDGRTELVDAAGEPPPGLPPVIEGAVVPVANGQALTLPLEVPGEAGPGGYLVAGVSRHRALDDDYRSFFTFVAGHVAAAIANARAHELARQRAEALAELDRAKTAFFSNVSHEFRTPLTLMLGPLEDLLVDGSWLAPQDRGRVEVAHRNAVRLLKLVNTLLDFARLEAERTEAAYEPVDLADVTRDVASVFRSAIERAGLRFTIDCEPIGEPVWVDREMWEKILLNLLSNALKFTFEGAVEVRLQRSGDAAELRVRDTGIGIAAEDRPRLFERFHRVRGARGRTHEGSGIGLALVAELAALHGGSASVESEPGRGSTFSVRIPLGNAHLPAGRIGAPRTLTSTAQRAEAWVGEALRWLDGEAPETAAPPRPASASLPALRGATILVADDNADMRDYLRHLLGSQYVVRTASDGPSALEAARTHRPDLVLADVMMPGMDGFALMRELRADERTRDLPVILLSARAGEEAKVEGLQAGADDYLVKPFHARELLARVEGMLRMLRIRRDTEKALRESESKFSIAFGRSPLALTITSMEDGRLVDVNDGFVRLSGYTREEAVGRTPEELGLWVDPAVRAERFARMRAGEDVPDIEARFRIRSGEELIGVIASAVVEIGGRPCVLSSVVDITARKRAELAKDQFLATLSHELRTPLTSGYGWVKLLTKSREPELLEAGLHAIENSMSTQIKLIDDLLDVSRIVADKLQVDLHPVDLAAVIHSATELVRPAAAAKQIELHVDAAPAIVLGDAARLKQVTWNVLSNAIKFTPAGGRVEAELRPMGESAELVVRDTGQGIDPAFLPHVFDRFQQADSSSNRRHGGLGLGLSIVKSLVEAHRGGVRVESDGPGRGTAIFITLPLAPLPGSTGPEARLPQNAG